VIACEDTRTTAHLLSALGITHRPTLIALHEHNERDESARVVERAREADVLVLTDAGMPGVSDPGYRVVQACIESGTPLEVLPGPSAVITALIGSGFPCHAFRFGGFLPVKSGKRKSALEATLASGETGIFFESPHRLVSTLEVLAEIDSAARVCVARELSKKFETYHRGSAAEILAYFQAHPPKGEIVLLVHGG
jgi:16S rRNA (cytidine1402-2'-O)-methyltransferase